MPLLDELEDDYLKRVASLYPLTDEDKAMIRRVTELTAEYGERRVHQLVSVAVGRKATYMGLQSDFNPGQASECAEVDATKACEKNKDRLRFIVTARKASEAEGGHVHLVWPCANCRIWLISFYGPDCLVIGPYGGSAIKVPVRTLYPQSYSPRVRQSPADLARSTADWRKEVEGRLGDVDIPTDSKIGVRYEPNKVDDQK